MGRTCRTLFLLRLYASIGSTTTTKKTSPKNSMSRRIYLFFLFMEDLPHNLNSYGKLATYEHSIRLS